MAWRAAHVLEIVVLARDAHALLRRGRAHVVARLFAEEGSLERDHARVHEHQRRIGLGHERRARHAAVPALLEEAKKVSRISRDGSDMGHLELDSGSGNIAAHPGIQRVAPRWIDETSRAGGSISAKRVGRRAEPATSRTPARAISRRGPEAIEAKSSRSAPRPRSDRC